MNNNVIHPTSVSCLYIALCEDERDEREHLLSLIYSGNIPAKVSEFEDGESFLKSYIPGKFDLILMDIYMNGISGTEAMKAIRKTDPFVTAAFITSSQDHALEAYRLNIDKYIEKPVSYETLTQVLLLAAEKKNHVPGITVLSHGSSFFVPVHQLLYVEQMAHYLHFHLLNGDILKAKGKLDQLQSQLEGLPLFRCHKSFLVNLSFVTGINRDLMVFHMKEGSNVYIRREAFSMAKQAWESWLFAASRKEW